MMAVGGGLAGGALIAVLVLVLGVTVTAYVAIGVAVLAIVLGCVDYVRSPNRRRHG